MILTLLLCGVLAQPDMVALDHFEIGRYEVTNQEFAEVLNWAKAQSPSRFQIKNGRVNAHGKVLVFLTARGSGIELVDGQFRTKVREGYDVSDMPMIEVSWYGAMAYCNWLSEMEGLTPPYNVMTWEADRTASGYRLPTEAEWIEAAAGAFADDCSNANILHYRNGCNPMGFSEEPQLTPVGFYAPNALGLYDMIGNVHEVTDDWYDATQQYRLLKGGSHWSEATTWETRFTNGAVLSRALTAGTTDCGLRVLRTLGPCAP